MDRSQLIKTINTGRHKLGWDDDLYRLTLSRFGGHADAAGHVSLNSLRSDQMERLLKHMRSVGFTPIRRNAHGREPNNLNSKERGPMLEKIRALVTDAELPWVYVERMAQRMYKRQALEFCGNAELSGLIAALDKAAAKRLLESLSCELELRGLPPTMASRAAILMFGLGRNAQLTKNTRCMSLVIRWLRGEIAPSSTWPREV